MIWKNVRQKSIPMEIPLHMKDRQGNEFIGMVHSTERIQGIIPLHMQKNGKLKWDKKTWKMGIIYWAPYKGKKICEL